MIVDKVNVEDLIRMMNQPVNFSDEEYEVWKHKKQSESLTREKAIRGSDFGEYWKCPRRLFWNHHDPLLQKSWINKSTYTCQVRHRNIERHVAVYGWVPEQYLRWDLWIGKSLVRCSGHIDALSPMGVILEIKHRNPMKGDLLQAGFYQLALKPRETKILLLYRGGAQYYLDVSRQVQQYLPRIYACVFLDVLPPLHPDFPRCFQTCEYYKRCGRPRTVKDPRGNQTEWYEWFKKTGVIT